MQIDGLITSVVGRRSAAGLATPGVVKGRKRVSGLTGRTKKAKRKEDSPNGRRKTEAEASSETGERRGDEAWVDG